MVVVLRLAHSCCLDITDQGLRCSECSTFGYCGLYDILMRMLKSGQIFLPAAGAALLYSAFPSFPRSLADGHFRPK